MNYFDTFIQIAPDCPVQVAVVPAAKGGKSSVAVLEYDLLSKQPYVHTQEELQFLVHASRQGIPENDFTTHRRELWTEFFSKPRACLRASALPKRYGWGIYFNAAGKIAIYPVETEQYRRYAEDRTIRQLFALRSRRS